MYKTDLYALMGKETQYTIYTKLSSTEIYTSTKRSKSSKCM